MSLLRSILNSTSPQRGYSQAYSIPNKHERDLELPMYNTPPPNIPSPIAKSMYRQTQDVVTDLHASTVRLEQGQQKSDQLLHLQRREQYLQQRLQELLDAQADGLLAGLSGHIEDDEASVRSGSSTPTAHSLRNASRGTSSQRAWRNTHSPSPRAQKPGLKSARREIYRTIRQLSQLKSEEDGHYEADQEDDISVLERIDAWEQKRSRLEQDMADVEAHEGGQDVKDLQQDADKMGTEIQELEIRLAQMKTRHRQLLAEIEEVDNSVQSKLTSYKSSLNMLDKEVKGFLQRPQEDGDQSSFTRLPPSRRTLELAKEHYQDRLNAIERQRNGSRVEREALDAGADVWKEVVESLSAFEVNLKVEMAALSRERDKDIMNTKTVDLLGQMEQVLGDLNAKLDLARERDWRLLDCCIGAEVEAFKQGKEPLEGLLPASEPVPNGDQQGSAASSNRKLPSRSSPMRRGRINSPPMRSNAPNDSDDDPDPELLISHQQDEDD